MGWSTRRLSGVNGGPRVHGQDVWLYLGKENSSGPNTFAQHERTSRVARGDRVRETLNLHGWLSVDYLNEYFRCDTPTTHEGCERQDKNH